jgi:RHS repeat-associated protein
VTYPNADVQTYDYDPMGNRTEKTHNSVPTAYSYDDADQMTLVGGVTYDYDDNGNQIEAGTDTFEWDSENRLIETNIASTTGTYEYNGDGLRITRTIGASAVSYVWDLNASLPVILEDTDGNRYVYGLDLLTRIDGTDEEWYLYDGLDSTTAVADDTGAITGSYGYDVFGAVRAHTGDATEWSYTGEQNDPTGLEYLRARYYDTAVGRFLSIDPIPLLRRYAYVDNNPANFDDPSGLCKWLCPFGERSGGPEVEEPDDPIEVVDEWGKDRGQAAAENAQTIAEGVGYLDGSATFCLPGLPACFTAGAQVSVRDGFHWYTGSGVGSSGFSLTWAPGQQISEGWNCFGQYGTHGYVFQVGHGGISTYEGGFKSTVFVEIGFGTPGVFSGCIYVH